jgi:hypothetical protein
MDCEIEITLPLRAVVTRYQRANRNRGQDDEIDCELYLPGGQRVYVEDLGLESDDIDSLVWEQIDRAEREAAA